MGRARGGAHHTVQASLSEKPSNLRLERLVQTKKGREWVKMQVYFSRKQRVLERGEEETNK